MGRGFCCVLLKRRGRSYTTSTKLSKPPFWSAQNRIPEQEALEEFGT